MCGLGFDAANDFSTQVWFANIDDVVRSAKKQKKQNTSNDAADSAKDKFYGKFVKCEQKLRLGEESASQKDETAASHRPHREKVSKKRKRSSGLDLDEVYRRSGGRTCHKGARHGISMSAKLERLQQQEEEFLKSIKAKSTS